MHPVGTSYTNSLYPSYGFELASTRGFNNYLEQVKTTCNSLMLQN